MIEINNLTKNYDEDVMVLKDLTLKIYDNEIIGLIGTSGAGKTTLLNCLTGLEKYQKGSIKIDDIELEKLEEKEMRLYRKKIGMIFQNFSLVNRKSVFQNIALPMQCWHISKEEINKKVKELATIVGLQDRLDAKPTELSGGQKQRVAIARALTMDPKYIICDECTSSLDPKTTIQILELLSKIRREMGITIILVTHEMEVVQQICDRMAIIDAGQISLEGDVKEMFWNQPPQLQKVLGVKEQFEGEDGIIIIFHHILDEKHKTILWEISQNINSAFELINTSNYEFVDGKYCEISIRIHPDDISNCKKCLEKYQISYRVWNGGAYE